MACPPAPHGARPPVAHVRVRLSCFAAVSTYLFVSVSAARLALVPRCFRRPVPDCHSRLSMRFVPAARPPATASRLSLSLSACPSASRHPEYRCLSAKRRWRPRRLHAICITTSSWSSSTVSRRLPCHPPSLPPPPSSPLLLSYPSIARRGTRIPCTPLLSPPLPSLLPDLFGIQARSGCACAGVYAHHLLRIKQETAERLQSLVCAGYDAHPGWARLSLHFHMSPSEVTYVVRAVAWIATHGWKLLPLYNFAPRDGLWGYAGLHLAEVLPEGSRDSTAVADLEKPFARKVATPPSFSELRSLNQLPAIAHVICAYCTCSRRFLS